MADLLPMVRAYEARARREATAVAATIAERRSHLDDIAAVLRDRFGAAEVVLFGSMVEGGVHAGSDVDLAVRGVPPARYFDALAYISDRLSCDVDLVELETARPSLRSRIAATGVALGER